MEDTPYDGQVRALVENLDVVVTLRQVDPPRYLYVSAAFERIFGWPARDLMADPWFLVEKSHPDDRESVATRMAGLSDGTVPEIEWRIIRADGAVRWIRAKRTFVTTRPGEPQQIAGFIEDITDRKAVETDLARSRDWFDAIAGTVPIGFAIRDAETLSYAYVSPAYEQIFQRTQQEFYADPATATAQIHPDDDARLAESRQASAGGEPWSYEARIIRPDGDVRWLRGHQVGTGGRASGHWIANTIEDVTEAKQVEVALRQAQCEAQRANDEKSAFLSRMSHELRTPLNAVIGFGQLLSIDQLSANQHESVDQIVKGGRHLLALINEVLDISRIESGGLWLSLEPVHLAEVVDEALAMVRHLGDARRVRVEDRCPPTCSEFVQADRQRLRQVVLNLLANAIKYNRDEGTVTLRCIRTSDSRIRLVVTDTGIGITDSAMTRLFSPFDRLGAEQTEVEGTGLGLTLTKRLVEAMGGEIGAESVAGRGSTFWVELERATAPATVEPAEAGPSDADTEVVPDARRVLYIEDNQANVLLVQRILSLRQGVTALVAMQASLGLDIARTQLPDLILLDLNLPDMPGVEALRRLRADPATADIPVVVISADATPGQVSRLRAEGAVDYLAKPFDIGQLLALVDEHTTGRHPA
jgi:PAS domain S-box-containing protein